jgi:DNA-binding transcriptional LysR family regulator
MRIMHEFLATTPFDLYELSLFHLVVKHRSFTKAAEIAGVTQSAITRQMQGMESALGVDLLERTTRSVQITKAGMFLYQESSRLLGDAEQTLQHLRVEFGGARKEVRVGVSRSIGLAYLPGFFHANLRRAPDVGCRVSYNSSAAIMAALEENQLDLGVVCAPPRLPKTLRVTHRFKDAFSLISSQDLAGEFQQLGNSSRVRTMWMLKKPWLLLEEGTNTGRQLRRWMEQQGLSIEPLMQLDSFDLIISLVALGMGISFVPTRALALYRRKESLAHLPCPKRFERELVVVVRRHRKLPSHLDCFIQNILF